MLDISENTSAHGGDAPIVASCADCDMLVSWLEGYKSGWQFGEQGVIEAVADRIGWGNRFFVEFGAGDGVSLPLTCHPLIELGWTGLLIEGDAANAQNLANKYGQEAKSRQISVCNQMVTVSGETSLLTTLENFGNSAPDVLVIDVDGADYHIWKAAKNVRARIVCIEHHDEIDPDADPMNIPNADECGKKVGAGNFGLAAGREAVRVLGESMGYVLVWRGRINSIFVIKEEADKLDRVPVRLNVGAGSVQIPGFVSLDIKTGTDMRSLPYEDGSVDEVYCSHALEHMAFHEINPAMREFARVLMPGGKLRVAVPDFDKVKQDWNVVNRAFLSYVMMGGQTDKDDFHKSMFDEDLLRRAMNAVGIGMVKKFKPIVNDATCTPHSLNLEGFKRHRDPIANPKITLVLSRPRLGFNDMSDRLIALAHTMKFNVQPSTGAFWDRDMEAATWNAINRDNPDFILYADYDGIFDPEDVHSLIAAMNADPTLACVGCVQMSRHDDMPLVFDATKDYSGPKTEVDFHHFGLTLIDANVFRELPTPWFWTTPGVRKDGTCGFTECDYSHSCDADITFWRIMREYGFRVAQLNGSVIGHMIVAIKWPKDSGFGVTIQPIEMFHKHGKPKTAKLNQDIFRKRAEEARKAKEAAQ